MNKIKIYDKMLNDYRKLHKECEVAHTRLDILKEDTKFMEALRNEDSTSFKTFLEAFKKHQEIGYEWERKRTTIKELFLSSEIMEEPYDAENKKLLKLIRDDKDPYILKVGAHDELVEYSMENYLSFLHKEYDLCFFLIRRMEAGRLILSRRVPPRLLRLFEKIKECYMFGLYEATIIFCRALLEEVLKIKDKRKFKSVSSGKTANKSFGPKLYHLIEHSTLPKELKERVQKVIKKPADKILHEAGIKEFPNQRIDFTTPDGKKLTSISVKFNEELQQEALSSIKAIISVIEILMGEKEGVSGLGLKH